MWSTRWIIFAVVVASVLGRALGDDEQDTAVCSGAAGYGSGCNQHTSKEQAAADEERIARQREEAEAAHAQFLERFAAFVFGLLAFLLFACIAFNVQLYRMRLARERAIKVQRESSPEPEFAVEFPSGELAIVVADTGGVSDEAFRDALDGSEGSDRRSSRRASETYIGVSNAANVPPATWTERARSCRAPVGEHLGSHEGDYVAADSALVCGMPQEQGTGPATSGGAQNAEEGGFDLECGAASPADVGGAPRDTR